MSRLVYTKPPFEELPKTMEPTLRWAGLNLVDQEQYQMEGWEVGFIGPHPYWQASRDGMEQYAQLRDLRRQDRKAAWQAHQEADEEWSRHVAAMVASAP